MARNTDNEVRPKRSFASINRIASGRWQVRYTDPSGARRYAPHTFADRVTAEAFVTNLRRRIDRDQWDATDDQPKQQITFGVYAAGWLADRHVAGRPIKPRTRAHYQTILDTHLLDTFGNRHLSAITPKDVRDWHAATLADRPTMRAHTYSLLRTIMASAVNDELIDANPCRIVGAGRTNRVHKIKPASVEELAVLTAAMPERLQLMVLLASWCALRFGETIELRRGDVDLSGEVIRIRRAAVRVKVIPGADGSSSGVSFLVTTPKSDAGIRDVDIPPHIIPIIEDHLAKYVGRSRDSLLFPADNGGHLQPSTLARHWYKARAAAGRPDLRWHDLRHSGAVLAALTGATLAELMERLGHSTPTAAMRYQSVARGRGREIASQLSKLAAQ
jgi:integrase